MPKRAVPLGARSPRKRPRPQAADAATLGGRGPSHAPVLDLKARDLREDLVAGDEEVALGQRRRRNPQLVVVEMESLAFQRCLKAAVGDAGGTTGCRGARGKRRELPRPSAKRTRLGACWPYRRGSGCQRKTA